LTEDDLLGRHLTDFIHPEDQEAYLKFLETDKKDAYPSPVMPVRIHTGDNNYQWLEGSGRKVGNRYYCAMYDISTRRENEAALKRREEQLADAQALAHMGHWHWQVGDDHLTGSDEMFRIFGVDQESTSSPVDQFHDLVHPDDLPRLQASFRKAVVNGTDVEFEFRIRQPGGELRHIHCEGRCELGDNGRTLALFGFVQDITEQKEAESELRLAKEAAEAAYQTKSRFLANMSHELRTPLNAIIGFAEMMEEELLGPLGNDSYDDYIQGIRQSGELLLDLITDILDMSKMEMGKYDIQRDEMDLIKAVRLSIHMVETRANEAGLTIQSQIPDNLDFVYADRRAVMQILLNLLSNAVKFTNPGGEIMVGVKHISDHIQLTVRDTGIGIPADKLDQVTRPFEQVSHEMTRRHNGTGLGLAITQSLVDLHDGQMMIDSQEDVGTTVKVTLPTSIGQNNDGK
jgi:two-component system cell cycle sensor histidine kinase PleC